MQRKIIRISVAWAERTDQGTRFRFYNVLPDEKDSIRAERLEELLDDLSMICREIEEARVCRPGGLAPSALFQKSDG